MATKKIHSVAGIPGKDPTLPKVPLELNGHTYFLTFDFNAIAVAEEKTGMNLLGSLDLQNLTVRQYRALLYSTMLKETPEITLEEVGNLVTLASIPAITLALIHAWTGSQPEVVKEKASAKRPDEQPSQS
jgi:hypothetical protein